MITATQTQISDVGNNKDEKVFALLKHTIVMQVENFLKEDKFIHPKIEFDPSYFVMDELDAMFPKTNAPTFGPEILVQKNHTCTCGAYEFPHRVAMGHCKHQARSVMDELLSLCHVAGYKDDAIVTLRAWADRIIADALNAKGVKAYHQYAEALRWIEEVAEGERKFVAKLALEELYLSQSVSNPDEWWIDGYTKEIDPDAQGELDVNRTAQKFLRDEQASVESAVFTLDGVEMTVDAVKDFKEDPIIEAYKQIYPIEQARKMAHLAKDTMLSSLGDEEIFSDFEGDDDRGFIPPPLEKSFKPDMQSIDWLTVDAFRDFKKECWNEARSAFPLTDNERRMSSILKGGRQYKKNGLTFEAGIYTWEKEIRNARFAEFKRLFFKSLYKRVSDRFALAKGVISIARYKLIPGAKGTKPSISVTLENFVKVREMIAVRQDFLDFVNELARKGDDPFSLNGSCLQAAAVMIYPFLSDDENDGVLIGVEEISADLLECVLIYEQEIVERSDRMTKGDGEDPAMIDRESRRFLEKLKYELLTYCQPERSEAYVLAFIAAMSAGANKITATATAWSAWRNDMNERGAENYDAVLLMGGKENMAWKAFWNQCSVNIPRPKSSIISASQAGLKIVPAKPHFKPLKPLMLDGVEIAAPVGFEVETKKQEVREINWGIAVNKMRAGEFDLSNKKAILALKAKGWREADYFLRLVERT